MEQPEVERRWPRTRWDRLISHRVMWPLLMSRRYGYEFEQLVTSRFYAGYLIGFPNYIALHDGKLAGSIRQSLIAATYEDARLTGSLLLPKGEALRAIQVHSESGDPQFNMGLQAGSEDGQRFFRAVEADPNPYDESTSTSLMLAMSDGLIDFDERL